MLLTTFGRSPEVKIQTILIFLWVLGVGALHISNYSGYSDKAVILKSMVDLQVDIFESVGRGILTT